VDAYAMNIFSWGGASAGPTPKQKLDQNAGGLDGNLRVDTRPMNSNGQYSFTSHRQSNTK
jgi:hypothetical protein